MLSISNSYWMLGQNDVIFGDFTQACHVVFYRQYEFEN